MRSNDELYRWLPGFNCGACGYTDCQTFAQALKEGNVSPGNCPVLSQERFARNKNQLELYLAGRLNCPDCIEDYIGLIDHARADFILHPLSGEPACRETLVSFAPEKLSDGMVIKYRPLGCPITHFARIIAIENGLLDVWVIGPGKLLDRDESPCELGICMVLSFQGVIEGPRPYVGQTVKFLPAHCMMGKVHSGVIVFLEGEKTRIDCIDLKIWEHTSTQFTHKVNNAGR